MGHEGVSKRRQILGNDLVKNVVLINAFSKTLEADELNEFNSLSYQGKMEIINKEEHKMTPLWSMSNLSVNDSDKENLAKLNEYQKDINEEKDYRMGLSLQKITPKVNLVTAAPQNPEAASQNKQKIEAVSDIEDKKEEKTQPDPVKTTNYVVQLNETIESMAKKTLTAQGKDVSDEKELTIAKQKIIADNKKLLKTNQKGRKFFLAGETVILQGEIDITGNKTSAEVKQEYKEKFSKK